jgi:pSer/pThr/pTyr-binding forkhead associated (FHA) protein
MWLAIIVGVVLVIGVFLILQVLAKSAAIRNRKNEISKLGKATLMSTRTGKTYELPKGLFTVGRSAVCDLSFPDLTLSKRHFTILADECGYWVSDLETSCGTCVNDSQIRSRQMLSDGDRIRAGCCIFVFRIIPGDPRTG